MILIKSISGIRGTLGGSIGNSLTPIDIVRFTASYASFLKRRANNSKTIIIGRDARFSGKMISNLVTATLTSCGFNVLDIGLSTTPTVEVAVRLKRSAGGIIITDWYNEGTSSNESVKITIRFLTTEVRADGIKIVVHKKKCTQQQNCRIQKVDSALESELQVAILRKAAIYEKEWLKKNKKSRPDLKD